MKKRIIRIIALSFVILLLFCSLPMAVFANTVVPEGIEKTKVTEDLLKMEAYSKGRFPVDETAEYCDIIDFIEYGYDYTGSTKDYGLYLYLYNPSCREIDTASSKNKIQLRAAPANENIAGGDKLWAKYNLTFLSKSNDNLFYKFKVDVLPSFMKEPDKSMRVYEIADVEFVFKGEYQAESVGASGKWIYTGYQEYHGKDRTSAKSTLLWDSTNLMTLDLEIKQASWKTKTSDKGLGYAYELSSVYFNVPNSIIKNYGDSKDITKGLIEVSGTYKNYKIRGVSVNERSLYDQLVDYVGVNCNENFVRVDGHNFTFHTKEYDLAHLQNTMPDFYALFIKRYDKVSPLFNNYSEFSFNEMTSLFKSDYSLNHLNSFGNVFLGSENGIDGDSFLKQIQEKENEGKLLKNYGSYRSNSYVIKFDGEDLSNLMASYATESASNFKYWLSGNPVYLYNSENYSGISPIVAVDAGDIVLLNDDAISEKYFISNSNVDEFKSTVTENQLGDTTFLLRYAVTDYFADKIEGNSLLSDYDYYFEKEIFLDFDILTLTWEKANGTRTVIPVKSSPTDNVGSVETTVTGSSNGNFVQNIFNGSWGDNGGSDDNAGGCAKLADYNTLTLAGIFIGAIVVLFLIINIPGFGGLLGTIFGFLFQILLLPIKLIGWLFEKIFVPYHAKKTEYKYKKKLEDDAEDRKKARKIEKSEDVKEDKKEDEKEE